MRIRLLIRMPLGPYTDFRTSVATQNRTILHERDSQAVSSSRERMLEPAMPPPTTTRSNSPPNSGSSGNAIAVRRNLVNAASSFGGWKPRSAEKNTASHRPSNPVRSWSADSYLPFQFDDSPILPVPLSALGPEGYRESLAIDEHLKSSRSAGAFQGATQSLVRTQARYLPGEVTCDRSDRVLHWHTQAVRQQIG